MNPMAQAIESKGPIVRSHNATILEELKGDMTITGMTIKVDPGDLVMIRVGSRKMSTLIGDAFAGLTPSRTGEISFLGYDWQRTPVELANALRGFIGRIFRMGNFVDYMPLDDSIVLPQLHHTRRPLEEIRQEAIGLCHRFGLPGLPTRRPMEALRKDLQSAACARAFLGRPKLIVLEEPAKDILKEIFPGMTKSISTARERGAAVIWLTQNDRLWRMPFVDCTSHFRVVGSELVEVST